MSSLIFFLICENQIGSGTDLHDIILQPSSLPSLVYQVCGWRPLILSTALRLDQSGRYTIPAVHILLWYNWFSIKTQLCIRCILV